MNAKQFIMAIIVIGIVGVILDYLTHGVLLASTYSTMPCMAGNDPGNMPWFILCNFVGAAVFVWFYSIVRSSFEGRSNGVLLYGIMYGIIISIPMDMIDSLIYKGFPYWLTWVWVIIAVVEHGIYGLLLSMFTKKRASA